MVKQGVNGVTVPDADLGGATSNQCPGDTNYIWNEWGNSMWPSVYLVDKQGRLRYWWYGELNWQGAGGQNTMAQRIEELLAETE